MPRGSRGGRVARGRGRGSSSTRGSHTPAANDAMDVDPAPSETVRGDAAPESENIAAQPALQAPSSSRAPAPPRAAPAVGRLRPKAVRRDEAGRDALAQQELSKEQDRAAADARQRPRGRGRGRASRAGRGRGGRDAIITSAPSGTFSVAPVSGNVARLLLLL